MQTSCDEHCEGIRHTIDWYVPLGRMPMQITTQNIPAVVFAQVYLMAVF